MNFICIGIQIIVIVQYWMLSFRGEIPCQDPISNMHRFHHNIIGTTSNHEVLQIDTRNQIIEKTHSYISSDYSFPRISESKYLYTNYGNTYFFTFDKKIVSMEGTIVQESNSKADFVRGLDAKDDLFAFGKHHKQHNKFSLNVKRIGSEKKIIKLMDQRINKVKIIAGVGAKSLLLETTGQDVKLIYGEGWQNQDAFPKANRFEIDYNYAYILSSIEKRSSPQKNSLYDSSESIKELSKVRVEVYDKQKMSGGKFYTEFQFSLPRLPIKIDSFQTDLIIAFQNSLQIYDIRKITKPFQKQNESGIKDFLYEPNLQRVYLSSKKGLSVYDYK